MSIANYLEAKILDKVFNNTDFTVAAVYASLHTSDPGETGANELASSGAYDRAVVSFGAASGGAISNDADVTFPEATADWGTVTHVCLWDGDVPGAGNPLWSGALAASRNITSGTTFRIPSGDLDITLD